jgi:hypothetical protein
VRVSEELRVTEQRREAGRRGDFGAALQRAEARRAEAGRADAGRAAQQAGERLTETRRTEAGDRSDAGAAVKPSGGGPGEAAARGRGEPGAGGANGELAGASGALASSRPSGTGGEPGLAGDQARAALTQAIRTLPPVIEAFGGSGREVLTIDFGGALGVELRQAAGGVEVLLSAPRSLQPAARTELAGLCRALAARGVAVASAEVRAGVPRQGRRR